MARGLACGFGLWLRKTQATAMGHQHGLEKSKPEPQATLGHLLGLGLAWLLMAGYGWLLAYGPGWQITKYSYPSI